ncbi:hypothetical protein [Herpetosiphon geysericola]|nr:hypothetical protein [Herpetosiphon geysericola]
MVGLSNSDGYSDVTESIPLQAIGATGAIVAANVRAVVELLHQAQRWKDGDDVSPVIMDIIMPGSNPAKILSQIIKDWDGSLFGDTTFDHINVRKQANMTLNLTRAGVWYHTSYRYSNLWTETDFGTVAPTTVNNGVTASVIAMSGFYGGRAYLQLTKASVAAANSYPSSLGYPVTAGQTYTLVFSHSHTNITSADVQLVRAGPVGVSGAPVTISLSTTAIDTDPRRFAATFVSSFTGTVYPYFQFSGPSGATFRIAEIMLLTGSQLTELWHPQYGELVNAIASASSTSPDLGNLQWRWSHAAYSPVEMTIQRTNGQLDYRHPAQFLIFSDKQTGLTPGYSVEYTSYTGTYGAPFTQALEGDAFGGAVLRYTPVGTAVAKSAWAWLPNASGGFSAWNGLLNILAGLRNNSPSTTFTVWIEIADYTDIVIAETPKRVIAANATTPTWYLLGVASVARRRTAAKWRWCVQASAASGTIDLNPALFAKIQPGAKVVQTDVLDLGSTKNFTKIVIDHQLLADRGPSVSTYNDGVSPVIDTPFSWWTNPMIQMTGDKLYGYMLAMNGAKWKTYLTGGSTVQTWQMTARRLPAYPTAE